MKHTQEPWDGIDIDERYFPHRVPIVDKNGYRIANVIQNPPGNICDEEAMANAKRIVACVNACAGINPEAVPVLLKMCERVATDIEDFVSVDGQYEFTLEAGRKIVRELKRTITKAEEV